MKRKTNVQIVKNIMEQSKFGPFAQSFVMQALSEYAERIAASKDSEYERSFIAAYTWKGIATEVLEKMAVNS